MLLFDSFVSVVVQIFSLLLFGNVHSLSILFCVCWCLEMYVLSVISLCVCCCLHFLCLLLFDLFCVRCCSEMYIISIIFCVRCCLEMYVLSVIIFVSVVLWRSFAVSVVVWFLLCLLLLFFWCLLLFGNIHSLTIFCVCCCLEIYILSVITFVSVVVWIFSCLLLFSFGVGLCLEI